MHLDLFLYIVPFIYLDSFFPLNPNSLTGLLCESYFIEEIRMQLKEETVEPVCSTCTPVLYFPSPPITEKELRLLRCALGLSSSALLLEAPSAHHSFLPL